MTSLAAPARETALTTGAVSLGFIGALLLLWVVWRTYRTGYRWYDAVLTVLLGVVVGVGGEGAIKSAATTIIDVLRAIVGFAITFFNALAGLF